MKRMWFFVVAGFAINAYAGHDATDDYTKTCKAFESPLQGGFCVHIPTKSSGSDLIYYFHGKKGDEHQWSDEWYYTEQVRKHWSETGAKLPLVVSISFGPFWLLTEKNLSPVSGLFEVFVGRVMPAIEYSIGGVRGRRILLGESMGGVNGLQLLLKTELFDKAAVLCTPMSSVSPFANEEDIFAHVRTTAAWDYYYDADPAEDESATVIEAVKEAVVLVQGFAPTPADYDKMDMLKLAENHKSLKTKVYMAIGRYDKYASFESNERFAATLKQNGIDIQWRPQWGGHCAHDIPSLADFLVH